MADTHILSDLLVIFVVSIAVVFAFHQLRMPSIAGFLVAGALIGPHGLRLVSDLEQVQSIAQIGVVLLLFAIGIEFSLAQLSAARRVVLLGGPLQVLSVLLPVTGVAVWTGLPVGQAVFWGCLLAVSSTAIMLKVLAERGEIDSPHGRASIGISIFQDLAVVPMMMMIPLLVTVDGSMAMDVLQVLAKAGAVVAVVMVAARVIVPWFLEQIVQTRSRELFLLTVIVLALGIAWVTSLTGLSLALGAFIAGLVISESEYSQQALAEIMPFRDSFISLFFVSVGMLMDFRVLLEQHVLLFVLVAAVLVGKFVGAAGAVLATGHPPRAAVLAGVALAQVGEFSFILAQEGVQAGLLEAGAYQVFLSVSVMTMIVTPFLIQWSPRLARRAEAVQRLRHWFPGRTMARAAHTLSPHVNIKDHVIIVGYGLNGRSLARVLKETEIPYLVLDANPTVVREAAAEGQPIYFGDVSNPNALRRLRIEDARVLVLAISDPFTARRAVQIARSLHPALHIVVRTRYLKELSELHELGADEVVPEEFETSIEIFALVLRTYKMPQHVIIEKAEQARREGYALLRRGELPELAHHLRGGTLTDVEVETIRVDTDSPAVGKALSEVGIRSRSGASVVALMRRGVTTSNPAGTSRLEDGDVLVLLGTREQLRRATGLFVDSSVS